MRARVTLLVAITVSACLVATGLAIAMLHRAALAEERAWLVETVRSQARLIEAVARFDAEHARQFHDIPGGATDATLSQIRDAHTRYAGFGKTGELTLARRVGDQIVFVLRHRHSHLDEPAPVPFASELAEPMRRALSGESGTVIGLDYRGVRVLAAHEPVAELHLGIVAKIDLAEVRAPFVKAGLTAIGIALMVVLAGAMIFTRISNPMIERLESYAKDLEVEITERKQAEERLRESEERLRLSIESAAVGVCLVDLEGRLTRVNRRMSEIFGYTKEELERMTVNDLAHPDDVDTSPSFIRRAMDGAVEQARFEKRYFSKKGDLVYGEISSSLVRDARGRPLHFISHVQDITALKLANEQTRLATERLQYLLSASPAAIYSAEASGDFGATFISDSVAQITGFEALEFVESPSFWIDRVHPEDLDRVDSAVLRVLEHDHGAYEYRFRHRDGAFIWVRDEMRLVRDEDGRPLEIIGFWHDVTERRGAEDEMRRSREKYRELFDSCRDGIVLTDLGGRILDANRAYLEMIGYSIEEALELTYQDLTPPKWHAMEAEIVDSQFVGRGYSDEFEKEYMRKDGTVFPIALRGWIVRDDQGDPLGMWGFVRDITERKRAEEAFERSRKQLRSLAAQLVRVEEEERQRLARELHDQVGQALTTLGIGLNVVMNQLSADVDPEAVTRLESAVELVEDTADCIRHVMSDLRPPVLDDYGVAAALRWFAGVFSERTGITVEVRGDAGCLRLEAGSETALFRVVQEALTNVAKHAQASRATVEIEEIEGAMRVTVTDDGVGFDASAVDAPSEKGGWGLVTMRERAIAMGGELHVESEPGRGTRVVVEVAK